MGLTATLALLTALPLAVPARPPTDVRDPRPGHTVSDETKTLGPADVAELDRVGRAFSRTGEVVVVVLDSLQGAAPRPFATAVFNTFRLDTRARNRGVLVLVALQDRKAEMILGDGWPAGATAVTDRVMQEELVARMKAGDRRGAVVEGAAVLCGELTDLFGELPSSPAVPEPGGSARAPASPSRLPGLALALFLAVVLFSPIIGIVVLIVFLIRRSRDQGGASPDAGGHSSLSDGFSSSPGDGGGGGGGGFSSGAGSSGSWE